MLATERMELLERIGVELQSRYTFSDIDGFFSALSINTQDFTYGQSKRVYVKDVLRYASEPLLLRVADELGLARLGGGKTYTPRPPANWEGTRRFRVFVSHISKNRTTATALKQSLAFFAIAGFVAHEDVVPTLQWQDEIERALSTMDAFVAIHTSGFRESTWCQQEVGFAVGRGVKIISLKMGEDPTGFLGRHQALACRNQTAQTVAQKVNTILLEDAVTHDKLKAAQDELSAQVPF
ncbi:toll/interleukin-1 receptor domain-containing protein [Sphingosinicellaceae bacterium]|nr:toll/interleukin-1 receptor domain-containing protein [Sphingosinicellaceae bacterium]